MDQEFVDVSLTDYRGKSGPLKGIFMQVPGRENQNLQVRDQVCLLFARRLARSLPLRAVLGPMTEKMSHQVCGFRQGNKLNGEDSMIPFVRNNRAKNNIPGMQSKRQWKQAYQRAMSGHFPLASTSATLLTFGVVPAVAALLPVTRSGALLAQARRALDL